MPGLSLSKESGSPSYSYQEIVEVEGGSKAGATAPGPSSKAADGGGGFRRLWLVIWHSGVGGKCPLF